MFFRRVRGLVYEVSRERGDDRKLGAIYAYMAQVRGLPRAARVSRCEDVLGERG